MVESTKSFKCPVATPNLETCLANLSQWPFAKFLDTNPAGLWWPTSQKATASNTEYWIAYAMGETVLFFESKCLFLVFVTQGGRSGEMEISLPFRFFAFCSHRFLWDKSVKRIRIPASGSWLRRWQALMRVLPALGTFKVSFASLIQDARVSSSLSFAAPATPLIIRAHFRRWTSNSNWRIARAVVMEAICVVIEGRASVITVSTRLSDAWTEVSRASTLSRMDASSPMAWSSFWVMAFWLACIVACASTTGWMAILMAARTSGSTGPGLSGLLEAESALAAFAAACCCLVDMAARVHITGHTVSQWLLISDEACIYPCGAKIKSARWHEECGHRPWRSQINGGRVTGLRASWPWQLEGRLHTSYPNKINSHHCSGSASPSHINTCDRPCSEGHGNWVKSNNSKTAKTDRHASRACATPPHCGSGGSGTRWEFGWPHEPCYQGTFPACHKAPV